MHVKEGQLVAVVGSVGSGMDFFIYGWKNLYFFEHQGAELTSLFGDEQDAIK